MDFELQFGLLTSRPYRQQVKAIRESILAPTLHSSLNDSTCPGVQRSSGVGDQHQGSSGAHAQHKDSQSFVAQGIYIQGVAVGIVVGRGRGKSPTRCCNV